jgi:hypothetical protein
VLTADKARSIGKSQRLGHLVGVNGFFSAPVAEPRRPADSLWWLRVPLHQPVRPDRPARCGSRPGDRVVFCLEYEPSTETLERSEEELTSYEDLQWPRPRSTRETKAQLECPRVQAPPNGTLWPRGE